MSESKYDTLKVEAAKLTDEQLLDAMGDSALALTVYWREAEVREQPEFKHVEGNMMRDARHGKKLFVSVYLSDRRGVHVSAFEGRKLRGL